MCGLTGMMKTPGAQSPEQISIIRNAVKELLVHSEVRGKDSAGIYISNVNAVFKSPMQASQFVNSASFKQALKSIKTETVAAIGHVRLATHGAVNKQNAHPLRIKRGKKTIVGTHNGVIKNWKELGKEIEFDTELDSAVIFGAVLKHGIKQALEKLEGSYALVWMQPGDNTVYVARDYSRPLYYMYWVDAKTMFYASTATILSDALSSLPAFANKTYLTTPAIFAPGKINYIDTSKYTKGFGGTVEQFSPKPVVVSRPAINTNYSYHHSRLTSTRKTCIQCGVTHWSKGELCHACLSMLGYTEYAECFMCGAYVKKAGGKNIFTGVGCEQKFCCAHCRMMFTETCDGCKREMPDYMLYFSRDTSISICSECEIKTIEGEIL